MIKRLGMEAGKENISETAVYGLACAYALVEKKIADYLRQFNLSPAKFNSLMVIKHIGKEKGLSQAEIGRRLIVTDSNMTRLLDKLEKEGFIERLSQKGDRRVNLIKISKKGSELLDRVWPGYYKKISGISGLLGREELKSASNLLIKWCHRIEGEADV